MKKLVAYFSASGVTKSVAETLADVLGTDPHEIKPEIPYTEADLDWKNDKSRSSVEMKNPSSRPAISGKLGNMDDFDVVFVGFPIWWYVAPTIINTFLESYDFSGKTLIPFATSGSSGLGKTEDVLKSLCDDSVKWLPGKKLDAKVDKTQIDTWVKELKLD